MVAPFVLLISIPQKENIMSAITAEHLGTRHFAMPEGSYEPGLRLINGDSKPFLSRTPFDLAKSGLSRFWSLITTNVAKAWGWVSKTLHLSQGWHWTQTSVIKPARFGIQMMADKMGYTGGAGAGLLLVSTGIGRKVLHYTIGVPAAFVSKWFGKGYHALTDFHHDNLGWYGKWVGDRMADAETWLLGKDATSGVVGKVTGFYTKNIAPHMDLNSIVMRTARIGGTALFGISLVGLLPLFITGSVLTASAYLVAGVTIGLTGWQSYNLGVALGSVPRIAKWLGNDDVKAAAKATVRGVNVATLVDDVAAETAKPAHSQHTRGHNPNVRSAK